MKFSFKSNSLNKTKAELFLIFKSIEYFNGMFSLIKIFNFEFISSITLKFFKKNNFCEIKLATLFFV